MKKSIAILASGLLVIVGLISLVHGSNNYHNAPYSHAAGGYPATSSSYKYGRNSAYGPYHSYAVRPALYGGRGLYNYRGYARHYPPPPTSGNHKQYQYDASSKSSSSGSSYGYGYGSSSPQQSSLYGMKPINVLLLVPDNSYKSMASSPAYGGSQYGGTGAGAAAAVRGPSYGKQPSYGQSHGPSYGIRPSYGGGRRPSSPYRSRRYRRSRSKCNQAMPPSPYAPRRRPSYGRRPKQAGASHRPRPAYGAPKRPQYSSYKPQKPYGGARAAPAPARYGAAAPYRPQAASNSYQAPQQQRRPCGPSQSSSSYRKY